MFSNYLKPALLGLACLAAAHAQAFTLDGGGSNAPFINLTSRDFQKPGADWTVQEYWQVQSPTAGWGGWAEISNTAYNALYGANVSFADSYALTNLSYGRATTGLSFYTDPDGLNPAQPFYFKGASAAAFTRAFGGDLFSSSTLTFTGYNGSAVVGSFTVDLSDTQFQWFDSPFANTALTSLDFTADAVGARWLIDDIGVVPVASTLAAPVPEPETWALFMLGGGAAFARTTARRRQRHAGAAQ
ncbi:PEP-CTERM sorting domain-containing protein [Amantichitinum ursilacus]|uniref:PEP-CTERM motif protein n=1 Tax=Amantichitinum ursilacus TaxID=857265 RepID=A0A0N0GM80_9NEIS|nr:PEP-CTERM sorting domain-containing protein [Amantichitinum ursilacus]KPC50675.1 PEP-CTERM motif protein [Amantichitinum ursilacus]